MPPFFNFINNFPHKYAIMQWEDFTKKARFTSRRFYYRKIYLILLYFNMFEHKNKPAN